MECYCYLRNIQDLLSDVKTPHERPFGMPLNGPAVPFGAIVEYHHVPAKDQSRLQTLKNWSRWTHLNSTPEGAMQRKC